MKAIIFNSGSGKRMGRLTENQPKCSLKLYSGETVLERQLRILSECGIVEIILTTGANENTLRLTAMKFPNLNFIFVNNPDYDTTNYIYSMYLSGKYLEGDILSLHGDLVFDKGLIEEMLNSSELSLCLVNKNAIQPLKDFKCRLENNFLREVSANIFDDDCYAFQPLYKLSEHDVMIWLYEVKRFVENGNKHVYAENALNTVLKNLNIKAISYENHYINEIDTPEDLARVQFEIEQFDSGNSYSYNDLEKLIAKTGSKKAFAVCGKHIIGSAIDNFLTSLPIIVYKYFNIQENPSYDAIRLAADKFAEEQCDLLISIGGGSAIDTTKGIKLFCGHENIKHIALPTTAGSGSEATQFAVIYRNGIKHSLEHKLLLPEYTVLDVSLLYSLGYEQKRISLLDALCQCIESYWSLNSNEESRKYAQNGINMILQNYKAYIVGDKSVYGSIFTAANYSGKAINISRTTVGHAMSYQLTSKFGIKHGQAVAMCLIQSMKYAEMMFGDDNRKLFNELSKLLQCDKRQQVYDKLSQVYNDMNFPQCIMLHSASPEELAKGVNADRLNNTFFNFSPDALKQIYAEIINNYS